MASIILRNKTKYAVFKFSVPLLSELLFNIGKIKRNNIIELQRSDLVGQYLRSTTEKTRANTDEAWGGVLFVDKAYHLTPSEDYGQEAIEELMAVMEDGYPIMIFAGYEKKTDKVLDVNPGLRSRIYRKFVFLDYWIIPPKNFNKSFTYKQMKKDSQSTKLTLNEP